MAPARVKRKGKERGKQTKAIKHTLKPEGIEKGSFLCFITLPFTHALVCVAPQAHPVAKDPRPEAMAIHALRCILALMADEGTGRLT